MRSLNVSLLANMSEQAILNVSATFTGLLELDLAGSSNSVTDYSIQLIFSNMSRLRLLNLDCCGKVTDDGIVGNINSSDVYYPNSILFLSGLRYLNLTRCYKISDVTLKRGLQLIELREISLARCQLITEDGIESLARNCPSLESIDLTECQNITDDAVEAMTRHLDRLKSLKLNHCSQLTDASLDAILKNCKMLKVILYIDTITD
jgi:Leucine Rich repeat